MITHTVVMILCSLSCITGIAVGYVIGYFILERKIIMVEQISSLFEKYTKLEDFLFHIQDEEARIELEIDEDDKKDYQYYHFWLSDFRLNLNIAKQYRDYYVNSFSFDTEKEAHADIRIYIKQNL